jgi:GNAT superfamily N-acetyltransferase
MKIRAANIRDLGRIEQLYREGGEQMSEAVPPARLWSLLTYTLSALLPLAQETMIYVAEDGGRVIGFVQASSQPVGMDLPVARALQVLNLYVVPSADREEVAVQLVDHLCNQALPRGVNRIFVRLPLDDPLTPVFRFEGFRQYATEQVLYSEELQRRGGADSLAGLRQARGRDKRLLYQLYRKVTPMGVAQIEAPTYKDWRSLSADWTMRPGGTSSEELVVERTEIVAWLKVQLGATPRPHRLSFLTLPEDHLPDHVAQHALNLAAPRGGAAWSSLRHYDSPMLEALRQRGFSILLTQALMVKELAIRVPQREKALVPSFG